MKYKFGKKSTKVNNRFKKYKVPNKSKIDK